METLDTFFMFAYIVYTYISKNIQLCTDFFYTSRKSNVQKC